MHLTVCPCLPPELKYCSYCVRGEMNRDLLQAATKATPDYKSQERLAGTYFGKDMPALC